MDLPPTCHRSSMMPPSDAAAGLLSGRGAGGTRISGATYTSATASATSPSSARSGRTDMPMKSENNSGNSLLSASLQNRLNNLPANFGPSPNLLSKSFPKSLSLNKRGGGGGGGGGAGQAVSFESDKQRAEGETTYSRTRKSTPGTGFAPPTNTGPRATRGDRSSAQAAHKQQQDRVKKRSKRLAQGAVSTYMTRGAGAALGADLLKIKLGAGTSGGASARRRNDAVTWISGVKVEKQERRAKSAESRTTTTAGTLLGPLTPTSPSGAKQQQQQHRLLDRPTLGTRGISERLHLRHDLSPGPHPGSSSSRQHSRGEESPAEAEDFDLQEEVIDVSKEVPQVTFEKIDIAKRSCTISLYGPWAHKQEPVFLRLSLRFNEEYPHSPPKFDLQHNASCALQTRAFLLRSLSTILAECAAQAQGCMEPCARFLAGSATIQLKDGLMLAATSAPFAGDSSDDESDLDDDDDDDEGEQQAVGKASSPIPPPRQTQMIRMLPGARCGASFGPNGQLVVFRFLANKSSGPSSSSSVRDHSVTRDGNLTPLPPLHLPLPATGSPAPTPAAAAAAGPIPTSAPTQAESAAGTSAAGSVKSAGTEPRPAGGRFLYSYAALTKAMVELTQMGQQSPSSTTSRNTAGSTAALDEMLHSSQAQLQAPELLSFMSSEFLARRLQAKSAGRKDAASTSTSSNSRARASNRSNTHPHTTNLLSSPLAFTAVDQGSTTSTATAANKDRQPVTEASTSLSRGRAREPKRDAGTAIGDTTTATAVATAANAIPAPRSRSVAIGRERTRLSSPLIPLSTLAHPKAVSELRIYSTVDVSDLTLRMARRMQMQHRRVHHGSSSSSGTRSASAHARRPYRLTEDKGTEADVGADGSGKLRRQQVTTVDQSSQEDTDDEEGEHIRQRPGFDRKRSESSPAAPRLRLT